MDNINEATEERQKRRDHSRRECRRETIEERQKFEMTTERDHRRRRETTEERPLKKQQKRNKIKENMEER